MSGSQASLKAAESAVELARNNPHSELTFAYVVDVNGLLTSAEREYRDYTLLLDEVRASAIASLRAAANLAAVAGVPSRQIIREGSAAAGLCALASELRSDVIAIGSRTTYKISRICGGSVRDDVIECASSTVFVVSEDERCAARFEPHCVMVPVEEAAYCRPALALAHDIAAAYGTKLLLLASAGTSNATLSREAEALAAGPLEVRTLRSPEIADRAIHSAFADNGVDTLVLGTQKRGALQRLFPSTAERILDCDRLPIFVVHGP